MTARWVVKEVVPNRGVTITWQPISLLLKNDPEPGSEYFTAADFSHRLLRVMLAVEKEYGGGREGNEAMGKAYWAFATRVHNGHSIDFDPAEVLAGIGLNPAAAEAFDDDSYDAEIRARMDEGLALTGDDVGTPLIGFDDADGHKVGLFGPVITRVPNTEQSLALWDGFVACAQVPGFWELKRTRTEAPDFGDTPDPL